MEVDSEKIGRILDQIQEKCSSTLEFSLRCEELREHYASLGDLLKNRAIELERKVKEFDMKEKAWAELRSKETGFVIEYLEKLEDRDKKLTLLEQDIRELTEAAMKDESFETVLDEKAEEMELKSKTLEIREKSLEQRERELELKQREFQEQSLQVAETCKRRVREHEADSRPAKNHKSRSHEEDNDCVVSLSSSCSEEISQEESSEEEESVVKPEDIPCLDAEFHDFKKTTSAFLVDQIWALYDPIDLMPRLYAKIKRIIEPGSSLEVTWLESRDKSSVPVACGRFGYGSTKVFTSLLAFSHLMQPQKHNKSFFTLNPSIGETWALFKDWNSNKEQHKPPYKYEFVEVVCSFDDKLGVGVAYLGKVKGFVSVFKRDLQREVVQALIRPEEMHRFSHKVPSFRLNGDEKEGVPAGSFELDPAAVPSSLLFDQSIPGSRHETPIVILA